MKIDIKDILIGIVIIGVLVLAYINKSLSDSNIDLIKFLFSN